MYTELKKDDTSLQKKSSDRHRESSANVDRNSDLLSGETTEGFNSSPSYAPPPPGQGQLPMQCKGLSESPEPTNISGPLIQRRVNNTGLPDNLKNGIENLSGYAMDDVKVHYNSSKPARIGALAYARGADIHLAQGEDRHPPHEAWHLVQQKQGQVKPTLQMKGNMEVNDDKALEREADVMGAKALQGETGAVHQLREAKEKGQTAQLQKMSEGAKVGLEIETTLPVRKQTKDALVIDQMAKYKALHKEASTGGRVTIDDQSSATVYQRKLQAAMNPPSDGEDGPIQRKANKTGLPDQLKTGIESLSGCSMDDVKVHYNSHEPAQLRAYAYAQGTEIHLGPGKEKHLAHEAWHVVQQKQGRVKPTRQLKSKVSINDDAGLEKEADVMGARAIQQGTISNPTFDKSENPVLQQKKIAPSVVQRLTGYEIEANLPIYRRGNIHIALAEGAENGFDESIGWFMSGGLKYGMNYGQHKAGRFQITADHNHLQTLHQSFMDKLCVLGLLKDEYLRRAMTNIEYITPPRQELLEGSLTEHREDTRAVKEHLDETLNAAKSGEVSDVSDTAGFLATGIPEKKIYAWMDAQKIPRDLIKGEVNKLKEGINDQVYVQQTSGVLPEDIPSVYEEKAKEYKTNADSFYNAGRKKMDVNADILLESIEIARKAFENANIQNADFQRYRNAAIGFMTIAVNYLLADSISKIVFFRPGNSSAKNMLMLMSKTPMELANQALPRKIRPTTKQSGINQNWGVLVAEILKLTKEYNANHWGNKYKLTEKERETEERGIVFKPGFDQTRALNVMVFGGSGTLVQANTGNWLKLDDPIKEVANATKQKSIPLEDRFFNVKHPGKLTASSFQKVVYNAYRTVVFRNLEHLRGERAAVETGLVNQPVGTKADKLSKKRLLGDIESFEGEYEINEDWKNILNDWKKQLKSASVFNRLMCRNNVENLDGLETEIINTLTDLRNQWNNERLGEVNFANQQTFLESYDESDFIKNSLKIIRQLQTLLLKMIKEVKNYPGYQTGEEIKNHVGIQNVDGPKDLMTKVARNYRPKKLNVNNLAEKLKGAAAPAQRARVLSEMNKIMNDALDLARQCLWYVPDEVMRGKFYSAVLVLAREIHNLENMDTTAAGGTPERRPHHKDLEGYHRKNVPYDGNCFYQSVYEALFNAGVDMQSQQRIRALVSHALTSKQIPVPNDQTVAFEKTFGFKGDFERDEDIPGDTTEFITSVATNGQWVPGVLGVQATADTMEYEIWIFTNPAERPQKYLPRAPRRNLGVIRLYYNGKNHYQVYISDN